MRADQLPSVQFESDARTALGKSVGYHQGVRLVPSHHLTVQQQYGHRAEPARNQWGGRAADSCVSVEP